jgi:hypothetical protein
MGPKKKTNVSLLAVLRIHDILVWIRSQQKTKSFKRSFSAYYFLKVHFHNFSKIKSQKKSQNRRNQGFFNYFYFMIEGSEPLTNGSGSGSRSPKQHVDPVDPDPQHSLLVFNPLCLCLTSQLTRR